MTDAEGFVYTPEIEMEDFIITSCTTLLVDPPLPTPAAELANPTQMRYCSVCSFFIAVI
jgi:hypothetical protein